MARGLAGRAQLGNFFVDVQRATFLVLLPIAVLVACLMVLGGMPMTLQGAAKAMTLEGAEQTIARGPVAAFVAIKQLGSNGGGFFGPNSTHPFENPSSCTNVLSTLAIIELPMASVWLFGRIVGRMRHATVLFAVMLVLLLAKLARRGRGSRHRRRRSRAADQPGRGQPRGQGAALRRRGRAAVGRAHDLHEQRLGQLHARQPEPVDRPDADDRHVAQRDASAASASA
jgi:hypothetical protein